MTDDPPDTPPDGVARRSNTRNRSATTLTTLECNAVSLIAAGLSFKAAAEKFGLSPRTLAYRVYQVMVANEFGSWAELMELLRGDQRQQVSGEGFS